MSGIIAGALRGLGEAGLEVTRNQAAHYSKLDLQEEGNRQMMARDAALERARQYAKVQDEERSRQQYTDAMGAVDRFRSTPIVSGEGPDAVSRAPNEQEIRAFRRAEMTKRGLMSPAQIDSAEDSDRRWDVTAKHYEDQARHQERTSANQERRLDIEEERRRNEFAIQMRKIDAMASRQLKLDSDKSTALTTNIEFMVKHGIAKDPAEAYEKLRTKVAAAPQESITRLTSQLLRSGDSRYRGDAGKRNAADDARAIVKRIGETGEADDLESGYNRVRPPGARGTGRPPIDSFNID